MREDYIKIKEIGKGAYGAVYQSKHRETGRIVAIKKMFMGQQREGIAFATIREIKALQEVKHPNIVELIEVYHHNNSVSIVYEYIDYNLEDIIRDKSIWWEPQHIKCYMKQIILGLQATHRAWFLHRDLKPGNVLVSVDGTLKLADYGLARTYGSPRPCYTPQTITRWYRPPELLFGAKAYGTPVDMWGLGCIFAEMLQRAPLFPGDSDLDQTWRIVQVLGNPTEASWPGVTALPDYVEYRDTKPIPFKQIFQAAGDDALSLLSGLIVYNPMKRLTIEQCLEHPYFHNAPLPADPKDLPTPQVAAPPHYMDVDKAGGVDLSPHRLQEPPSEAASLLHASAEKRRRLASPIA